MTLNIINLNMYGSKGLKGDWWKESLSRHPKRSGSSNNPSKALWCTWYYPLSSRDMELMSSHQRPPFSFKKIKIKIKIQKKKKVERGYLPLAPPKLSLYTFFLLICFFSFLFLFLFLFLFHFFFFDKTVFFLTRCFKYVSFIGQVSSIFKKILLYPCLLRFKSNKRKLRIRRKTKGGGGEDKEAKVLMQEKDCKQKKNILLPTN